MKKTISSLTPTARARELGANHQGIYFGALDGYRGLLAIIVAIYHTAWVSHINETAFFQQGAVIIDLFFVFSGFLMFTLYGQRLKTVEKAKTFLWRRFARLYPVHFVMTMAFLAFSLARLWAHNIGVSTQDVGEILPFQDGASETFYSLLTNLSLTQAMGLHDSLTFNPPAWTISVEFYAYFLFAAMLLWLPPKKNSHFVLIGAAVVGLYVFLSRVKPDMNITYDFAFWRCLAGFYTGVIGAEVYKQIKAREDNSSQDTPSKSGALNFDVLEIVALGLFIGFVIYMPGPLQFFIAPFALLFVIVFAFDRGFISRFMMTKPFAFLAKVSYSVYMVHVFIAIAADVFARKFLPNINGESWHNSGFNGDIYLVPYLIVVLIAGYMLQRYVEVPCAKWLGGLGKSRRKTALNPST